MASIAYTPRKPKDMTRSARRRRRIAINRKHRRMMQRDHLWRAELRAWVIKDNVETLQSDGLVLMDRPAWWEGRGQWGM